MSFPKFPLSKLPLLYFFSLILTAHAYEVQSHRVIFPPGPYEPLWRTLSSMVHLVGVSVLAYCLARRTDKLSFKGFTSLPLTRWLVILIFIDSWLFIFSAGLLITGVGLSLNQAACSAGIYLCILLYATTKLLIYWFLVEKVHLVHPHPSNTRLGSPAYRLCMFFTIGYAVIVVLLLTGRISFIRDGNQAQHYGDSATDGVCVIGLGARASLSLLVYDLLLNVFFTCMFLYPVYRSPNLSPRLKLVAKRTLIAALVALLTSAANVCILTLLHGKELGAVCLGSCGLDTIANALAIFAVTSPVDNVPDNEDHCGDQNYDEERSHPPVYPANRTFGTKIAKILPTYVKKASHQGDDRNHNHKYGKRRPPLPRLVDGSVSSSMKGILEKSTGTSMGTGDRSTVSRSVHFPPEVMSRISSSAPPSSEGLALDHSHHRRLAVAAEALPYDACLDVDREMREVEADIEKGLRWKKRKEDEQESDSSRSLVRLGTIRVSTLGKPDSAEEVCRQPTTDEEETTVQVRREGPLSSTSYRSSWLPGQQKRDSSPGLRSPVVSAGDDGEVERKRYQNGIQDRWSVHTTTTTEHEGTSEGRAGTGAGAGPEATKRSSKGSVTRSFSRFSVSTQEHRTSSTPTTATATRPSSMQQQMTSSSTEVPLEDEARVRSQVLTALTEISGGKRKKGEDVGALEVSVVTEMEQRVELRKQKNRKEEVIEDYRGSLYAPPTRRGRSYSSSGGL